MSRLLSEQYDPSVYGMQENKLVQQLHSQSALYAQVIAEKVLPGSTPFALGGGHMCSVHRIDIEKKTQVIKIFPYDRLAYGEQKILQTWRQQGVPVPQLIESDFSKSIVPYSYLVMEYLSGVDNTFATFSPDQQKGLLTDVVSLLRRAHEISENSFGWINYHLNQAGDTTWQETVDKFIRGRGQLLVNLGIIAPKQLLHFAERSTHTSQDVHHSALLHGDLTIDNILFNRQHILGFIDSDPIGGDGLYDTAYLSTSIETLGMTGLDPVLLEGYLQRSASPSEAIRWEIYKGMSHIRQLCGMLKKDPQAVQIPVKITQMNHQLDLVNQL